MSKKVILIGGFVEIVELCHFVGVEIVGVFDKNNAKYLNKYKVLGNDSDAEFLADKYNNIPLIITPDSPNVRKKLKERFENFGYMFDNLVSLDINLSKSAKIGNGNIIQSGVNISSEVTIGNFVKLNTRCNIMHNAIINDYVTVAPNAVILGNVKIGESTYIGSNATILPNINITKNVTIGAGAVVTKNITEKNSVYAGVPAKKIK